jgi:hypothetical protein
LIQLRFFSGTPQEELMAKAKELKDLLLDGLKDIDLAEKTILSALPRMAKIFSKNVVLESSMVAVGCLLSVTPASAQSVGEKTGISSALDIAPATADFVREVASSDIFEMASSKLAQKKGNAAEIVCDADADDHRSFQDFRRAEGSRDKRQGQG